VDGIFSGFFTKVPYRCLKAFCQHIADPLSPGDLLDEPQQAVCIAEGKGPPIYLVRGDQAVFHGLEEVCCKPAHGNRIHAVIVAQLVCLCHGHGIGDIQVGPQKPQGFKLRTAHLVGYCIGFVCLDLFAASHDTAEAGGMPCTYLRLKGCTGKGFIAFMAPPGVVVGADVSRL